MRRKLFMRSIPIILILGLVLLHELALRFATEAGLVEYLFVCGELEALLIGAYLLVYSLLRFVVIFLVPGILFLLVSKALVSVFHTTDPPTQMP